MERWKIGMMEWGCLDKYSFQQAYFEDLNATQ